MRGRSSLGAMTSVLSLPRIRYLNRYCRLATLAVATLAGACQSRSAPAAADAGLAAAPPDIKITENREDLIFSFRDPKSGEFATASSRADVPEEARQAVVVTDLSLTPEQRQAGRYIYVTDLRQPRDDGTFPVAVSSRYGFEAKVTGTSTVAGSSGREVVVYSTAWCGVCKKAKRLLTKWGVPFVEKDIEASRKAQQELAAKSARAGVRPGGVPVIDVAGTLMQGLDERQLQAALRQQGFL